jgi:hypothetical protein
MQDRLCTKVMGLRHANDGVRGLACRRAMIKTKSAVNRHNPHSPLTIGVTI